jgi:tetratricopeptide (TPR) repeat protein
LSEDFADALIDVANALSSHGKIDTAISILEQGKKLDPAPGGRMYEADFTRILAELYAKNGQADKAIPTLVQGFETNGRSSSAKDYALAAQLSEQSKDYISAAKFYYEAGKSYGNGFTEEQRESMLRKSIECANHAKDSDEFTLAKAYKDLSSIVSRRSSSEALSLLEKSVALVPDSAREKAEELASISYLRGQVVDAKTKTSGSVNAAVELSSAEFEVRSEPLRRAAELASKNNSTEAGNYWLQLARLDVQGKHFGAALDDARKAIATYKSDSVKTHTISQLIDANFPLLIAKAGAPDKAEQIMREAQNQVDTLAGAGSLQSQVQMSHHFIYLYTQKLYSQADSVLDAFLNTDLNQGHYASPNHNMTICRLPGPYPVESSQSVIDRLIQELPRTPSGQDNVHEIHVLNKILSAEKKQFGQNDYRVGLMFVKIGGVFAAANQNDEAYKNFIAALNIMHQYESLTFALNNLGPDFATVMQKLHKQHELEKFEEQKLEEQKSDPFGMRKKTR